jgi:hypothetical protein
MHIAIVFVWRWSVAPLHWTVTCASWNGRRWLHINWNAHIFHNREESIQWRSPITFKENKRNYADEEEEEGAEESIVTSKKRRASSDDNNDDGDSSSSSSNEEVSFEEDRPVSPLRWCWHHRLRERLNRKRRREWWVLWRRLRLVN